MPLDTHLPVTVRPWPHTDHGHAPTSVYAEMFWLPVVGPTALWLYRRLTTLLATYPEGVNFDVADMAAQMGVQPPAVKRTIDRLADPRFALLRQRTPLAFEVRATVDRLTTRQLLRLPESLQAAHVRFEERQAVPA